MLVLTDKTLFTNAVMQHVGGLMRFAVSLCRNEHNAEDLVSETVLKAFENFTGLKDHSKLKSWLYRILYNQFVSEYRKNSRMKQVRISGDGNDSFSLFEKLTATGAEDPEKDFLQKLTAASVRKAIEELPLIYKQTIVLSDMEQFSYHEIAGILKVPIGTVRSRLARGRQQLEKALWQLGLEMGLIRNKLISKEQHICTCGKEETIKIQAHEKQQ